MRLDFRSESSNKREISILAVLRFEKPFERDVFRFNPFSTFRDTTFVRVNWNAILVSRHGMASHMKESRKEVRRLIFEVDLKLVVIKDYESAFDAV